MSGHITRKDKFIDPPIKEVFVTTGSSPTRGTIRNFQTPRPLREVRERIEEALKGSNTGVIRIEELFSGTTDQTKQK